MASVPPSPELRLVLADSQKPSVFHVAHLTRLSEPDNISVSVHIMGVLRPAGHSISTRCFRPICFRPLYGKCLMCCR